MTYGEIIDKVLALMDEQSSIDGGLVLDDTNEKPLEAIIAASLSGAWRSFVFYSPLHYLPIKTVTTRTIDNLVLIVAKPTDFIRLASFMASSWSRPCSSGYYETDPIYTMQRNEYTKGKPTRPVVIIRPSIIEGYSALTPSDTVVMTYVPSVDFTNETATLVADNIADAFCYHVAGLVYSSFGNKLFEVMFAQRDALCK